MTDVELLLAACCQNPEEDMPRLMLADAIQAEGWDGAADYIRADIELCRSPKRNNGRGHKYNALAPYQDWVQSMTDVFTVNRASTIRLLLSEPADEYRNDWKHSYFAIERGLPTDLDVSCPTFMRRAEWLFRFPVAKITFSDRRPELDQYDGSVEDYVWDRCDFPQKFNTWEEVPHHIPAPLFDLLKRGPNPNLRRYRNVSGARKDLNRAALLYGTATRTQPATAYK